jgi:hypothetical protein
MWHPATGAWKNVFEPSARCPASTSWKINGGRPSRRSIVGSTAENSPFWLAANKPSSRSASDSGTPWEISPARHSASGTVTRVTVCPVNSEAILAMSARSRDCGPVSGGVIPPRLPSSVSAMTAASARSACAVQETLPSSGATSLPVSSALPVS